MVDAKEIPTPPPPLPAPLRLFISLSALCSTLHPANPAVPHNAKWHESASSAWLRSVFKLLEIDQSRLPRAVDVDSIISSASEQHEEWSDEERVRIAGVLVEASLAVDAQKEKEEALRYTPLARALSHRTLDLLGLPAKDLLPQAEKNLGSTLFKALKAAKETEPEDKVESTRAAHSQGWGGSLGRSLATGAGVIAGGVLIGVTGGLAAPAMAALLAPLGIGGLLSATAAPVVLGTLFGVGGGGLAGKRVRERWKGVEEFGFVEVGDGTKATKEEIEDLSEARKKMQQRKEQEKAEAEKEAGKEKKDSMVEKGGDSEKGEMKEKGGAAEKPATMDEKMASDDVDETEDIEEPSEEEAAKAVEEDRDFLEERLLQLSLQAGTRSSISHESDSRRPSLDSPRPSLEHGVEEKAITEAKKPPSLTVSVSMKTKLTTGYNRRPRLVDGFTNRSDHSLESAVLKQSF